MKVGHVPDVRLIQTEVHIVREQGFSARGMLARRSPSCSSPVRTVHAGSPSRSRSEPRSSRGPSAILATILLIVFVIRCGRLRMRLTRSSSSPVGGRSRHEPTGYRSDSSFGIVQLRRDAFAREFRVPVSIQHLHHHHADADGVDAGSRVLAYSAGNETRAGASFDSERCRDSRREHRIRACSRSSADRFS